MTICANFGAFVTAVTILLPRAPTNGTLRKDYVKGLIEISNLYCSITTSIYVPVE